MEMGDYVVVFEVLIIVKDVEMSEDVINVVVSKVIKVFNKEKFDFVWVEIGYFQCLVCGVYFESVFVIGSVGFVGMYLMFKVYNVQSIEYVERIVKVVVGKVLKKVFLKVFEIREFEYDGENGIEVEELNGEDV